MFTAEDFVPTKFTTAKEKAKFANQFVEFVNNGFQGKDFTQEFYSNLIRCFHHIAHDLGGFWRAWFDSPRDRLRFLHNVINCSCAGDPKYTFSDVQRKLRTWVEQGSLLNKYSKESLSALRLAQRDSLDGETRCGQQD